MDPINPEIQALREQLANAEKNAELRRKSLRNTIIRTIAVIGAVLFISGYVHIVTGSDVTIYPCWKTGWSISNTFVNADDYKGNSIAGIVLRKDLSVAKALFQCGLLDTERILKQQAELDDWSRRVDEYRAQDH